jgi:carboxyl-terminal processing protease
MCRVWIAVVLLPVLVSCAAPPPPPPSQSAPPPSAPPRRAESADDFRPLAEAFHAVKTQYVTPVDESALAASCMSGIRQHAAKLSPPLDLSDVAPADGARPGQQIGDLIGEAQRRRPEIDRRTMVDACLATMLESLDKLSSYLDRAKFRDLQVGSADLGGIGIELKLENGFPIVVSLIEGAPASHSDLVPGDVIVKIDGVSTEGLKLEEVVKRMRGKPKSAIVLTLRRAGVSAPIEREFKREIVRVQTVKSAITPEGYLHVRITQFQDSTLERFADALKSAYGDGSKPAPGIILDLRNNTGGLLNTAVGIAAVFLPDKALVTELKGRTPDNNKRMVAAPDDYLRWQRSDPVKTIPEAMRQAPLVVIVNRQTASGGELVAAALQDHQRAKLIGERTHGIGTIQTIIPMAGGSAIKLTTAKFHRPNGQSTEGNPVVPDVLLSASDAALPLQHAADPALARARELLRR